MTSDAERRRTMTQLASQRDQVAEQAFERLRHVVYLVLNAVRMRRRSRAFSSFSRTEKTGLLYDVKKRLHELVSTARKDHDLNRPSPLAVTASHIHHKILSKLHEDDFQATAESLLNDYFEVREWFFHSHAFESWQAGGTWYLHCFGEPRSGKSAFAAAVARWLRNKYSNESKSAVVALFLGHGHDKQRFSSYQVVLEAVLRQLIESKGNSEHHQDTLGDLSNEDVKALRQSPDLLQEHVVRQMASFSRVFLIVDGLDESATGEKLDQLKDNLVALLRICAASPCKLRLMLVQAQTDTNGPTESQFASCDARGESGDKCAEKCQDHYWRCEHCPGAFYVCHPCFGLQRHCLDRSHILKVNLEINPQKQSVVLKYVKAKLESTKSTTRIGRLMSGAIDISQHIEAAINQKAAGILVVAKLYIDSLIEQQSIEEILDVLDRLPSFQRLYYNSFMFEIIAQPSSEKELGLTALSLVAATCNFDGVALTFEELSAAIILLNHRRDLDLTKAHLLECTKGFLKISDTVAAFHESAGIFIAEECKDTLVAHVDMTNLCTQAIKAFQNDFTSTAAELIPHLRTPMQHLKENPFVAYAMRNWATYSRSATSPEALCGLSAFLDETYERNSTIQQMIFLAVNKRGPNEVLWTGGTKVHFVAWFGLETTLQVFWQRDGHTMNPNAQDSVKRKTPLHLACIRQHSRIALILLQMGADVSTEDCEGRTALWEVVENDDAAILLDMLEGPHPAKGGESMRQALNAQNSHYGNQTVLMLAVQRGSENDNGEGSENDNGELVEILLRQPGLDINTQDAYGRTALHIAASRGYITGLELLTGLQNVDFSLSDTAGRTPVIAAIASGEFLYEKSVHFLALLEGASRNQTFDVNAVDNNGRSLLHYAATDEGYLPIVKCLATMNVEVNKRDCHGRTPLHNAAWNLESTEDDGVIQSLIAMQADLLAKDEQGMTPCDFAAQNSALRKDNIFSEGLTTQHPGFVIPWSDADSNPKEFFLSILDFPKAVMDQANPVGYTLLHCAVDAQNLPAVEHLLRQGCININAQAQDCQTALHMALNNLEIVQLLLSYSADVNILNALDRSPLECALDIEEPALSFEVDIGEPALNFEVAIALVNKGARLILAKERLQEILAYAIRNNHQQAASTLLDGGASLFLYCRAGLLPSETAKEENANERMIKMIEKCENGVLGLIAGPRSGCQ